MIHWGCLIRLKLAQSYLCTVHIRINHLIISYCPHFFLLFKHLWKITSLYKFFSLPYTYIHQGKQSIHCVALLLNDGWENFWLLNDGWETYTSIIIFFSVASSASLLWKRKNLVYMLYQFSLLPRSKADVHLKGRSFLTDLIFLRFYLS